MQLLSMVQREFDKHYRELKRGLKEENEENDMRVRVFGAPLHWARLTIQSAWTDGTSGM